MATIVFNGTDIHGMMDKLEKAGIIPPALRVCPHCGKKFDPTGWDEAFCFECFNAEEGRY